MSMSAVSTTCLFPREVEKCACRRRLRHKLETTESEERDERDSQLERKLASIRRSTRHLRDKLTAERDELEAARVKHAASFAASHQYLPRPPQPQPPPPPQISPSHNPYFAYQMSLQPTPWTSLGYPGYSGHPSYTACYHSMEARNPYASWQNLNYMPFSPMHRLSPYSWMDPYSSPYPTYPPPPHSLFNPLYFGGGGASVGNLGDILNSRPSVIPMISETYNQLDRVDRMCQEESKRLKQFKRKMRKLQVVGENNNTSSDESHDQKIEFKKVRKRRRHHRHNDT